GPPVGLREFRPRPAGGDPARDGAVAGGAAQGIAKRGRALRRGRRPAGTIQEVTMRALVCHAYGPIESLKIEDVPKPAPAAGEILVKVGAAGVSFAAMLGIQGKHQNKPALPFVPGNEIA